jgi:hypothetical protein
MFVPRSPISLVTVLQSSKVDTYVLMYVGGLEQV